MYLPHSASIAGGRLRRYERHVHFSTPLLKRQSTTCSSTEKGNTCEKPVSTSALPIALGVIIPLAFAIVIFIYLHRRYRNRLRQEDRKDAEKYKSMDFGMDLNYGGKKKKKKAEMTENSIDQKRKTKGISMDIGSHPFMFAGAAPHQSMTSLNSPSRAGTFDDNPYRPTYDGASIRSGSPAPFGRSNTDSTLTSPVSGADSNMHLVHHAQPVPTSAPPRNHSLHQPLPPLPVVVVDNDMPPPVMYDSPQMNSGQDQYGQYQQHALTTPERALEPSNNLSRDSYFDKPVADLRKSNNYLSNFIHSRENSLSEQPQHRNLRTKTGAAPSVDGQTPDSSASTVVDSDGFKSPKASVSVSDMDSLSPSAPSSFEPLAEEEAPVTTLEKRVDAYADMQDDTPRHTSFEASLHNYTPSVMSDTSNYTDILRSPRESSASSLAPHPTGYPQRGNSLGNMLASSMPIVEESPSDFPDYDEYHTPLSTDDHTPTHLDPTAMHAPQPQRLSILMRPLPPDDPTENPEERANRIRSFYKEYFDDSSNKAFTSKVPLPRAPRGDYYEDYGQEYTSATVFDAHAGAFVVADTAPFAQPVTRRAMTPPPRAPPRFASRPGGPRSRAASNASASQHLMPPRNHSALSSRLRSPASSMHSGSGVGGVRKAPLPPPATLNSLPTPHLLKDDAAIFGAADFAPPVSFRERQNGRRPDSPLGTARPYSPSVRAHVPLASSFEDLGTVPSPHALRKSGTFTSLSFAPPTRLRNVDSGSDVASIRSGRSGLSNAQVYHMRAGAYRLSRIPQNLAGTKDDIMAELRKPRWDLKT